MTPEQNIFFFVGAIVFGLSVANFTRLLVLGWVRELLLKSYAADDSLELTVRRLYNQVGGNATTDLRTRS